jgi:hypothetical protein
MLVRQHDGRRRPPTADQTLEVICMSMSLESTPPDMGQSLLEQIFELWLRPELESRGLDKKPEEVVRALITFPPGRKPQVLIDTEAPMVIRAKAARAIKEGEPVTEADIDAIESLVPHDIDPNAGWIGFILFRNAYIIRFDFRRNRDEAAKKLERAKEYLEAAGLTLEAQLKAPTIDALYAAAELAVDAQRMMLDDQRIKDHQERRRWFSKWTKLGNAPSDHGRALADLGRHRGRARYGEGSIRVRDPHLRWLAAQVSDMLAYTEKEIGARP